MALKEEQIVRYSRQILLPEVGGRGQERLLHFPVRVLAAGPGIDDAVAWLVAGGCPVQLSPGIELDGFLFDCPLALFNPDAVTSAPAIAELMPWGTTSTAPVQVVLGAGVAFRSAEACADCFTATTQILTRGSPDCASLAGSLGALIVQHLALGWAAPLGLFSCVGSDFKATPPGRCSRH